MTRLIDADALSEKLCETTIFIKDGESFQRMINDAPTVDAVEVVRCGECKHMLAYGRCTEFADDGIRPSATDFCSYGEREDGE